MPAASGAYAAAGALAGSAALGVLRVLDEFVIQRAGLLTAVATLGVALATGACVGLWYPRRLIRRRLEAGPSARDADAGDAVIEADFAALMTAALLVCVGIAWGLTLATVALTEGWRDVLVRNLVWPTSMIRAAILAPLLFATALSTAVCTAAITALLGWHRAVTAPRTSVTRVWLWMVGSAGVFATAIELLRGLRLAAFLALLLPFVAAVVAVSRRTGRRVAVGPTVRAQLSPALGVAALGAGASGALVATSLTLLLSTVDAQPGSGTTVPVVITAATLIGVALARRLMERGVASPRLVIATAAGGVALCAIVHATPLARTASGSAWCAGILTLLAAVVIVSAGRVASCILGRPQSSVVWVGGTFAVGCAGTLALAAAITRPALPSHAPIPGGAQSSVVSLLSDGLASCAIELSDVFCQGQTDGPWDVDLRGPVYDAVFVLPTTDRAHAPSDRLRRRLIKRAGRALLPNGRLVYCGGEPAPDLAVVAAPAWTVAIRPRASDEPLSLTIRGDDVPFWIASRLTPDDWDVRVAPREER